MTGFFSLIDSTVRETNSKVTYAHLSLTLFLNITKLSY